MTEEKNPERSGDFTEARPTELSAPVPRKVRMDTSGGRFLFVTVLFCFAWGTAILAFHVYRAIGETRERDTLRRDGREAAGTVISEAGHRGAPASVSYAFSFDGVTYLGKAEMPVFRRMIIRKSDPITILFLPSNPAINHPEPWEWTALGEIDMAEILAPFLIAMGCIALMLVVRDRKLAREGKVAKGVVVQSTPDKTGFRLTYEFHTDDGAVVTGSCDSTEEYGKGANIWVLYLPKRPRRNHSYPLDLFSIIE